MRTTLTQYKASLTDRVKEIDRMLENRQGTPEIRAELECIERQLEIFEQFQKKNTSVEEFK